MTEEYWQQITVTGSPHGSITVPIPHTFGCTHATVVFQKPVEGSMTLTFEDQVPYLNACPLERIEELLGHKVYYQYGPTIVGSTTPPINNTPVKDPPPAPKKPAPISFRVRQHSSPMALLKQKDAMWFDFPMARCCQCNGLASWGPVCGHISSLLCDQCFKECLKPVCVKCTVCDRPAMVFDRNSLLEAKYADLY